MLRSALRIRSESFISLVLLTASVHSMCTGIGLILHPDWLLLWGGWHMVTEPFFPVQGGLFHVLMALLYLYARSSDAARVILLPYIIVVKAVATGFLFLYAATVEWIWMVAASGFLDGLFAVALFVLWRAGRIGREEVMHNG
ncbi:MAG: hypothetical protein IH600_09700 [Bacteroidetes bacterium]|nr:hypothetical protein [Bacteroidota bacterium]